MSRRATANNNSSSAISVNKVTSATDSPTQLLNHSLNLSLNGSYYPDHYSTASHFVNLTTPQLKHFFDKLTSRAHCSSFSFSILAILALHFIRTLIAGH